MNGAGWILSGFAGLSAAINAWQWSAGLMFPLHRRKGVLPPAEPPVTLLKPLKGVEPETAACLESWLSQSYSGAVQVLFGVASLEDPVCQIVKSLIAAHPGMDLRLVHCQPMLGPNAKVSSLVHLQRLAEHPVVVISDADVFAPPDFLREVVPMLADPAVGLVNCFYTLVNAVNAAMRWETVAVNADFWSQVLQNRMLKPIDFALGAAMVTRADVLEKLGGFEPLLEYLADDYQLGNRVARLGLKVEMAEVGVECRSGPMGWREVWAHQLRWSRTVKFCQPVPYFFSILANASLWAALACLAGSTRLAALCLVLRIAWAFDLERRATRSFSHLPWWWMPPVKDLLHFVIWGLSFIGNEVVWRGRRFKVLRGGRLTPMNAPEQAG